jgi:hypothetical protein
MRMLMLWVVAGAIVSAQTPPRDAGLATEGTGSISGVAYVDAENGGPIRGARVELTTGSSFRARVVFADDRGRFTFDRLPAGRFNLTAKKAGFIAVSYGAKRIGGAGVPIALEAGEHAQADVRLLRAGAISGTIRGPDGEPASGVRVQAFQYDYAQGERTLQLRTFSNSQNGQLTTDDRGIYRIYGLKPGEYYFSAAPNVALSGGATSAAMVEWAQRLLSSPGAAGSPPPARSMSLAYVFFPGTTDLAAAAPITVAAGQEVMGIDLTLSYTATATVSGIVTGPDGQPAGVAQVSLVQPGRPFGLGGAAGFIRPTADGTFSASGIMPGEYKLAARGSQKGVDGPADATTGGVAMPLWSLTNITITGEDVRGLEVKLAPGTTVSGRLIFDATTEAPPADLTKVTVSLLPMRTNQVLSMAPGNARVSADGTFVLTGVGPGIYRLSGNLSAAGVPNNVWFAKSSIVAGADTLDEPLEIRDQPVAGATITFTDHAAQLSGSLLDTADRPVPEYFVVLFSTDRKFWVPQSRRVRSVRPGTTGRFTLNGLPPGDYYVCALTDVETNRLSTPEYLEPLIPAGIKITLAEGEKKTQDLKVAR